MALKNFEVLQKSSVYGGEEFYDHPKKFELGDLYFDVHENRLYWIEGKDKIRSSATNGNDVVLHVSLKFLYFFLYYILICSIILEKFLFYIQTWLNKALFQPVWA